MVLHLGVLGSNHRNIYKKIIENLLLQSHLAQMPEIQYVALPSSSLPSLFRWRSWDPTWLHAVGAKVQTKEIHRKIFNNLLLQNQLA